MKAATRRRIEGLKDERRALVREKLAAEEAIRVARDSHTKIRLRRQAQAIIFEISEFDTLIHRAQRQATAATEAS